MGRAGGQLRHATLKIWQKLFAHRRSAAVGLPGKKAKLKSSPQGRCTALCHKVCNARTCMLHFDRLISLAFTFLYTMLMWKLCCAESRSLSASNGGAEEGERTESDSDSNHRWSMIEQRLSRLEAATQQLKGDTRRLQAAIQAVGREQRRHARMMRWHNTVLHGGEPASYDSRKMIWPVQEHNFKCTSNFCT